MELTTPQLMALVASVLLAGGLIGGLIDTEKAIYQCKSNNLLSNCNKLGAEGQRCYYNATNSAKYSYCAEGWTKLDIINENSGTSGVLIKNSYRCEVEGCELWK